MFPKFNRMPEHCYESLGLNYKNNERSFYFNDGTKEVITMNKIALGKFEGILRLLYSSNDGSLDNNLRALVSENAPEDVRNFVNNYLLKEVQPLMSASDDETAFATILPRTIGTLAEFEPYADHIKSYVESLVQSPDPAPTTSE